MSATAVVGIALWDVANSIKPGIDLGGRSGQSVPVIGAIDGGVNLLVVGSDSGEGDPRFGDRGEHLGDVTMLLHIAQDHSSATVVSFPRDLLVEVPACAASAAEEWAVGTDGGFTDKLNSAYSYGGLACTTAAVSQLTGLEIPFAASIEFNGVIQMSNAVGGVPVCITETIEDERTGFFREPGEYTLQGWDALQFLRTRYGLKDGSDLARIGNQQSFLASLARTIKSSATLSDPTKVYGLAKAAARNMRLSETLSNVDVLVSIAGALKGIDLDKVVFVRYPTVSSGTDLMADTNVSGVLMAALADDEEIVVAGRAAATVGDEPVPPTEPPTAEPVDPSAGVPASPGPVVLPDDVTGQRADQVTCTAGRPLDEQQ
ncbi:LCP family protein [Luethyella okanaganae]|uniref:LCP family protein n=1 Tax=Luethyella okanaganae TaxID=69372 RepID=UPI0036D859D1